MAAPLAQLDEDWQDFYEFKPVSGPQNRLDHVNSNVEEAPGLLEDLTECDNCLSGEIGSFKSMEDLASDFEEKLAVCFQNCDSKTENVAPVKPITEDDILKNDEIWNALTDNYGSVMPVDWKTSHTRSLHLPTLNLAEKGMQDNISLDVSDDEELREQLDMHTIIVSCISEEPLFTAEQEIKEFVSCVCTIDRIKKMDQVIVTSPIDFTLVPQKRFVDQEVDLLGAAILHLGSIETAQ